MCKNETQRKRRQIVKTEEGRKIEERDEEKKVCKMRSYTCEGGQVREGEQA